MLEDFWRRVTRASLLMRSQQTLKTTSCPGKISSQGVLAGATKIRNYRWRMPLSVQCTLGVHVRKSILSTAGKDFRGLFVPIIQPREMRASHDSNNRIQARD